MKQIYGIDLSKEKFDVNFLSSNNKAKSIIVKNNLNGIVTFLEKLSKDDMLCVEHTGVYGDLLLFLSNCLNIPISISSGYEIKHSLGLLKGKSDKIDAQRIREYGERFYDKLKTFKYPDEEMKELKELYNMRSQLVKERKMLITHQKGKSHMAYNSIKANEISQGVVRSLDKAIEDLEIEILAIVMSKNELKTNYNLVKSIKGIGQVTACDLIVKTGNFKEIDTARKAASYAGVCPFPNSNGKMVKKSRVSNMADKELKSLLYLCSVVAVSFNPEYKLYHLRKKQEGKPYFLIMNNVANKLLRTVYSIINSGKEYTFGYITIDLY
ncbi:MAG: IS110 family transposase [Bacteroidota bacterium]|nr:IS110 family transposase [Bacteroidota bacterium]